MTSELTHISVLQKEAVEALALQRTSVVVDATLGSSGHAREILMHLSEEGTFVGIDADETAIEYAKKVLVSKKVPMHLCVGNFRDIDSILDLLHIKKVDAILADFGWRMEQFSGSGKGFSFAHDETLLMTYGNPEKYPFVAHDILNDWKEEDIRNVLKGYGEEKFAGRIARHIVERREISPIMTTLQLVSIIEDAVPSFYRRGKIHPATRTFQALRIAVNDEFETIELFVKKSIQLLNHGGRLAIITFHSIEDRIVKHLFKNFVHDHIGVIHTKKPIVANNEELLKNPRARSAKLRIFEKL